MASIHVIPECQTVPPRGRLENITDEESPVSPLTDRAVHVEIIA